MRKALAIGLVLLLAGGGRPASAEEPLLRVGSKKFTEGVILGELAAHLARRAGYRVRHRRELGGTRTVWSALTNDEIDAYVEYTGTIGQEILAGREVSGQDALRRVLARRFEVGMSEPLGFNNTYAIGMKRQRAERLGIETVSDLREHPDLEFGFSNEFMDRADGWPGLKQAYGLPQTRVQGLEHHLAYRGLDSGAIAATDVYTTDAEIEDYDLRVLEDDRGYFPEYEAVLVYRAELRREAPDAVQQMLRLEGRIDESDMIAMNARAKLDKVPESRVAADFLQAEFGIASEVRTQATVQRLLRRTGEHLYLVGISLTAAILLAVPLGIIAAKSDRLGQPILGAVGIIQTIPSLALLVFMIPLLGIGAVPAMAALFLYSLLPIVRNTYAGLHDIPPEVRESAVALGLPAAARLRLVELPMSARSILAGIKTSSVINIGTATLGALIGAGGYGQPILTGIRLDDVPLILQGAVPAALMALAAQGVFELLERLVVPHGLRLKGES